MYVRMLRVRLGLVLGRHPKINLFGLHYCVICCEVETKSSIKNNAYIDPGKKVLHLFSFFLETAWYSSKDRNAASDIILKFRVFLKHSRDLICCATVTCYFSGVPRVKL